MDSKQLNEIIKTAGGNLSQFEQPLENSLADCNYFQSAQFLYLATLKQSNPSKFNEELARAAFLFPDRRYLYTMLQKYGNKQIIADENNLTTTTKTESAVDVEPIEVANEETTIAALEADKSINVGVEVDGSFDIAEKEPDDGKYDVETSEINTAITSIMAEDDILEFITEPAEQETNTSQNLIDQFLNNIPTIQRKQEAPLPNETFVNEDISLDSVAEPEELATELLAEIYIKQRYFDKAIEVYKKLSLKFPEKSGYFATQIEKINQGLNY